MKKNPFQIKKIDDDTFSLREPFSNCMLYLLTGRDSALLIDTGMGTADLQQAVQALTQKPVTVVNTHGHLDHIANNHQFENIYLCDKDREVFRAHTNPTYVKKLVKQAVPAVLRPFLKSKMDNMLHPKPGGVYHPLAEGHCFDLGGRVIEVIETPGHTPGSVCLLEKARKTLYTGDTICDWGILLHLDYSLTPQEYLESVKKLSEYQPLVASLHPGHRLHTLGTEYIDQYLACAEGIVSGTLAAKQMQKGGEHWLETRYGSICIQHKNKAE